MSVQEEFWEAQRVERTKNTSGGGIVAGWRGEGRDFRLAGTQAKIFSFAGVHLPRAERHAVLNITLRLVRDTYRSPVKTLANYLTQAIES